MAREAFGMRGESLLEYLLAGGIEPRRLACQGKLEMSGGWAR